MWKINVSENFIFFYCAQSQKTVHLVLGVIELLFNCFITYGGIDKIFAPLKPSEIFSRV